VDIERHISWPVGFCVRHNCVSMSHRLPQSTAQHGDRIIRPCRPDNMESAMVGRIGHRDCRRVSSNALVAWSTLVVDFVDGDVPVSRGTVGISAGPGGQVAPRGIASKRVGKV
jgi:hypothetical protein